MDGQPLPFTACASDPGHPHGENIFARAVAGDFGPIAPYVPPAPLVPDRVSSRQFRLQLLALGLLDTVEGWIDAQPLATQIAYQSSATFERGDAMMQAGFDRGTGRRVLCGGCGAVAAAILFRAWGCS